MQDAMKVILSPRDLGDLLRRARATPEKDGVLDVFMRTQSDVTFHPDGLPTGKAWRQIGALLKRKLPAVEISEGLQNSSQRTCVYLPAARAKESAALALKVIDHEIMELTYPVQAESISRDIALALSPHQAAPDLGLELELSAAGLYLLTVILDRIRILYCASFLQQAELPDLIFAESDLLGQSSASASGNDYRYLTAIVGQHVLSLASTNALDLGAGLAQLETLNLVSVLENDDENLIYADPLLFEFAMSLHNPLPQFYIRDNRKGAKPPGEVMVLRGVHLWCIYPTSDDGFVITTRDGLTLMEDIFALVGTTA